MSETQLAEVPCAHPRFGFCRSRCPRPYPGNWWDSFYRWQCLITIVLACRLPYTLAPALVLLALILAVAIGLTLALLKSHLIFLLAHCRKLDLQ